MTGNSRSARRRAARRGKARGNSKQVTVNVNTGGGRPRRQSNRRRRGGGSGAYTYVDSLVDPEMVPGVKIPDIVAFPTGTFQVVCDGVLATGTGGDTVGLLVQPYIGLVASSIYPMYYGNGSTPGAVTISVAKRWPGDTGITGIYGSFRPVSGMAELEFIGPSSADGGMMAASLLPSNYTVVTSATTWDALIAAPNTEVVPVRNGIKILWKPEDNADFEFVDAAGGANGMTHQYPKLRLMATGLAAGSTTIRFHTVFNFEAIPGTDATNLAHTDPSPYNANHLRKAFEWAAQVGNNIFTLYQNAGPYLAAAGGVAARLGYNANYAASTGNMLMGALERRRNRARALT